MSRKLKQVISCQSFSPISDVRDGIIVTKDGKFVKLMEFSPINYGLRSNEDKNMITAQYAAAIRSFPSVVQIKVLSNRANVEHYISGMVESVRHEKNEGTRELMREQIDMMSEFGTSQGVSRRFFLAFQYGCKRNLLQVRALHKGKQETGEERIFNAGHEERIRKVPERIP